jgi:hypothetical protein
MLKQYASDSMPNFSSGCSSSPSSDSRDNVHGRPSSAHSIETTSRRTAETGTRRELPSQRGCFL